MDGERIYLHSARWYFDERDPPYRRRCCFRRGDPAFREVFFPEVFPVDVLFFVEDDGKEDGDDPLEEFV